MVSHEDHDHKISKRVRVDVFNTLAKSWFNGIDRMAFNGVKNIYSIVPLSLSLDLRETRIEIELNTNKRTSMFSVRIIEKCKFHDLLEFLRVADVLRQWLRISEVDLRWRL